MESAVTEGQILWDPTPTRPLAESSAERHKGGQWEPGAGGRAGESAFHGDRGSVLQNEQSPGVDDGDVYTAV